MFVLKSFSTFDISPTRPLSKLVSEGGGIVSLGSRSYSNDMFLLSRCVLAFLSWVMRYAPNKVWLVDNASYQTESMVTKGSGMRSIF